MDAVKFLRTYQRMCRVYDVCKKPGCPMQDVPHCDLHDPELDIEKAVEAAEKWDKEHPEKTMAQDFFEKFPNAPKGGSAMMTREEAIKALERADNYVGIHYINGVEDPYINPHLKEAIKVALSNLRPVSREQVEKVWRGEWVGVPNMGVYDTACSKCGYCPGIRFWDSDFCPNCGAPMTDEAVQMVMERLEALKDGKGD